VVKRRLAEALGFALLLACLLLMLTLLTMTRAMDRSTPRWIQRPKLSRHDGAVLADLLWQSSGSHLS